LDDKRNVEKHSNKPFPHSSKEGMTVSVCQLFSVFMEIEDNINKGCLKIKEQLSKSFNMRFTHEFKKKEANRNTNSNHARSTSISNVGQTNKTYL